MDNVRHGILIALFAVAMVLVVARPAPAAAALKVCNQTSYAVNVAIGFSILRQVASADGSATVQIMKASQGWWPIPPGQCQTPLNADLDKDRGIFLWIERDGSPGQSVLTLSGTLPYCVDPNRAFQKLLPQNSACPDGMVSRPFVFRATPQPDYTETLS